MRISFLGGGNMASALIGGMLERGFAATDTQVVDLQESSRAQLAGRFGVRAVGTVDDALLECDVLVLAVKPQQMKAALAPLAGRLARQVVVSIAAGLRLADIGRWLGGYTRLVRVMPNTPALIGAGVSGLYADPSVDTAGRAAAERVLAAVGSTVWIADEAQMDAVTAVSGSGPAYVFHFIEALEAAGASFGFDAATARQLAIDTVLGAAKLAAGSDEAPGVLRERVTSKGGTTEAALASMKASGFFDTIVTAVKAAEVRGRELGEQLGKD
ncbi:pyrroline-5-carboxylate reductase [Aromatoleum toluclasticum]|uniref:pyrroline-5-carboxylate reductase n=1 Tax=Aromatoleum toluclasticum TaxID=92003 RepID=UPI001D18DEAB|nr:pyrroline-5-carboxylate reductase [Aromatoleum toluclasticum]MCC4115424.1 pyrroline-5-carboxylate reductase [Aromatoleum toluclasticum]